MGSTAALMLSVALIGMAVWLRLASGTFLQPGSFFTFFWCFAGILPLIIAPDEHVEPNVVFWLIAAGLAISAGAVAGNGGLRTRRLAAPSIATERELFTYSTILGISLVLGIGSNLAFMKTSSISFADLFSIQRLVVAAQQAYVQRYADAATVPSQSLSQGLLPFVYLGPAVGGILFELSRRKGGKLLALSSFFPAIAVTILQTTKAAVLFAITLWLSGYFVTRLRFGKLAIFTKGHMLAAGIVGSVLTIFLFAVSLARLAATDVSLLNLVLVKLVTAAFGHMTVFSQWLTEYWQHPLDPSLGAVTFAGPLDMLGIGHRVPGLFENVIDLVAGETSNIYTAFRPLIQDFSIGGALAILVCLGFIGGTGFRLVVAGKWSGAPLLFLTYMTIFWTPMTWFWVYNSLTAAVVAVGLIVFFIRLWRSRRAPIQRERVASTT